MCGRPLIGTVYDTIVAIATIYALLSWSGGITNTDKKKLGNLIKGASSDLVLPCAFSDLVQREDVSKAV